MSLADSLRVYRTEWSGTPAEFRKPALDDVADRLEHDYVIIPRADLPAVHVPPLEGYKYAGTSHTADHARQVAIKLLGAAESIERRDARDAEQRARIDRRRNELAADFFEWHSDTAAYASCSAPMRRAIDAYIALESGVTP